jgi:hypothetical protein
MEETQFIVQKAFSLTIGGRFTLRPIDGQKDKRTKGQSSAPREFSWRKVAVCSECFLHFSNFFA